MIQDNPYLGINQFVHQSSAAQFDSHHWHTRSLDTRNNTDLSRPPDAHLAFTRHATLVTEPFGRDSKVLGREVVDLSDSSTHPEIDSVARDRSQSKIPQDIPFADDFSNTLGRWWRDRIVDHATRLSTQTIAFPDIRTF
jgi:hypothetical protein